MPMQDLPPEASSDLTSVLNDGGLLRRFVHDADEKSLRKSCTGIRYWCRGFVIA